LALTNDELITLKQNKIDELRAEISGLKQEVLTLKTDAQIYDIYILQSRNVRKLDKVKKSMVRELNRQSKRNNNFDMEVKTKLISLLYSAWSEAQFVQILHTPKGFFPRELKAISDKRDSGGIISGWYLMIQIAISKVLNEINFKDIATREDKLKSIIKGNIEKQSILRNKIAHGQWVHALNRPHTAEGPQTDELNNLDYVQIDRLFSIHKYLGSIVRDLVQSPKKGFHNNYHNIISELEGYVNLTKDWNSQTRKTKLNSRPTKRD